ncbi:MAG: hypothetical protein NTZ87_00785 [Candidatus Nomurabacteria bacterium]|nr:hypothetical protein [Candidatus Nomurabacteria bacterium]
MKEEIDYGPVGPELARVLKKMRETMSPDQLLILAKLIARTVATDGNEQEKIIGHAVDEIITAHFHEKFSPSGSGPSRN